MIRTIFVRAAMAAAMVSGLGRYPSSQPRCSDKLRYSAPWSSAHSAMSSSAAYRSAMSTPANDGLRRSKRSPKRTVTASACRGERREESAGALRRRDQLVTPVADRHHPDGDVGHAGVGEGL